VANAEGRAGARVV